MRTSENPWYKILMYGLEYIGKYYGQYRAFVNSNEDPKKMGRLQLIIPHLHPTAPSQTWAWPIGNWGANGYGVQMLPQVGDMVWVTFEYGNQDYPLWQHASYGKEEIPEEFKTPNHYGFKTPNGSLILINDNKGEEEILVRHSNQGEWIDITKQRLELEAKLIKLGKEGHEWAALGETTKDKIEELITKVNKFIDKYNKHKHLSSGAPPSPDDIVQSNQVKVELNMLKGEIKEILSKKVKIDR